MPLIPDCFSKNQHACEQLYFWAYLWPRIREELELPLRIVPEPAPGPHGDPYALDSALAAAALGPHREPAIRLAALQTLHDKLERMAKKLEVEMKELHKNKT